MKIQWEHLNDVHKRVEWELAGMALDTFAEYQQLHPDISFQDYHKQIRRYFYRDLLGDRSVPPVNTTNQTESKGE